MRSLFRNLLALLALLASFVAASTTVVHADPVPQSTEMIGIRLVDPDPADPLYIVGSPSSGDRIVKTVEVSNSTMSRQTIEVYAGAATNQRGLFAVMDRGVTNRLTSWTSVSPSTLDVPSGQTRRATVTIDVPATAPVGNQYAVIWAQAKSVGGTGVVTTGRPGVRSLVTVVEGSGQKADFQITKLTAQRDSAGRAVVVADIRNSGDRDLDLESLLTLTPPTSQTVVGTASSTPDRVLLPAGGTGTLRFVLPDSADLPAGPWTARVTSKAGVIERVLDDTLTFPAPSSGGSLGSLGSADTGSAGSLSSPWLWAGVAGVAAVAGGIGWTVWQQQNPPQPQ